jgi:hypothetical protein
MPEKVDTTPTSTVDGKTLLIQAFTLGAASKFIFRDVSMARPGEKTDQND